MSNPFTIVVSDVASDAPGAEIKHPEIPTVELAWTELLQLKDAIDRTVHVIEHGRRKSAPVEPIDPTDIARGQVT